MLCPVDYSSFSVITRHVFLTLRVFSCFILSTLTGQKMLNKTFDFSGNLKLCWSMLFLSNIVYGEKCIAWMSNTGITGYCEYKCIQQQWNPKPGDAGVSPYLAFMLLSTSQFCFACAQDVEKRQESCHAQWQCCRLPCGLTSLPAVCFSAHTSGLAGDGEVCEISVPSLQPQSPQVLLTCWP